MRNSPFPVRAYYPVRYPRYDEKTFFARFIFLVETKYNYTGNPFLTVFFRALKNILRFGGFPVLMLCYNIISHNA
mgnify:CR=1 FL=1